jgi:hypothetical protein
LIFKENGLYLKNFHFSQKFGGENVAMATMMCKAFYEHSGYLFLTLALKIIFKKKEKRKGLI